MKKIVVLLLALALVFSLVACGGTADKGETKTDTKTETKTDTKTETKTDDAKADDKKADDTKDFTVASGFGLAYDPDYDYFANPTYKVVTMYSSYSVGALYTLSQAVYEQLAPKTNCELTMYDAQGDVDALLNNIEMYAAQGYDGVIFQCAPSNAPRIQEVILENDMAAGVGFGGAYDDDGHILAPLVAYNRYSLGYDLTKAMAEWAVANWPDFDPNTNAKCVYIDHSILEEMHLQGIAAYYAWTDMFPDAGDNYIYQDILSQAVKNAEGAANLVSTLFSANPDVKYWVIVAEAEMHAYGAASAISAFHLEDRAITGAPDCFSIYDDWDAGTATQFIFTISVGMTALATPYWFSLYAYMNGDCTPEEIWPDYKPADEKYAYVPLHGVAMTPETYKDYLAWCDELGGVQLYPNYKYESGTDYQWFEAPMDHRITRANITFDPTNGSWTVD